MHTAQYDNNGNIILVNTDEVPAVVLPHDVTEPDGYEDTTSIQIIEDVSRMSSSTNMSAWTVVQEPSTLTRISSTTKHMLHQGASEGKHQLLATVDETKNDIADLKSSLISLPVRIHGSAKKFWRAANTPVTLPRFQKNGKKPPTKLRLFVVDTIRFGGTFAMIFVVLFVGINYQSFLQIAWADLAIDSNLQTQQGLEQMTKGKIDGSPHLSGVISKRTEMNMLAVLPRVGPYKNSLIIPKLGKNVPIVRPSMEALMQEDWVTFEEDIQEALHDGVVFYPGSAEPGRPGNFFLTGHSSYYPWAEGDYKDVFARLGELVVGDTYSVYYGGDLHVYRVTSKKEVKPNNVTVLDQPTDKRIATLMTCTPVGTTLRRLIVVAEEIDPVTGVALAVGEKVRETASKPVKRLESLPI